MKNETKLKTFYKDFSLKCECLNCKFKGEFLHLYNFCPNCGSKIIKDQ